MLDQKRRNEERSALIKMAALYQDKAHASQRQFVDAELDENRKALDAIAAELNKFEVRDLSSRTTKVYNFNFSRG